MELTQEHRLAIARFPDENPNPVLRVADDGRLLYANPASEPVVSEWGVAVGDPVPEGQRRLLEAAASGESVDIVCGARTYALTVVRVADLGFCNVYGSDVTHARVIARMPDLNPNPVLRLAEDGSVLYANPPGAEVLGNVGVTVGDQLPESILADLRRMLDGSLEGPVEAVSDGRTFALSPVRVRELGFISVYATDITVRRAIEKFPDENPNPVFRVRWDGSLTYANPASVPIIEALGCRIGQRLNVELLEPLLAQVRENARALVETVAGDRIYSLTAVEVPAFGFINVYGTDVTAARHLETLHRDNERLLLNILPESIADRLRLGESLIADRFDDVTLMFADIVEFTRISSELSPDELVSVLNDVFTVFDDLVDRYGLEKVKTIGDAYMVVGGMPERSTDHVERAAEMAIALADSVAAIDAATRLGIRFRIGMHCGPVVGGVIGRKKFIYDVWGDTVNTASRMESLGIPGRTQVTDAVEARLRGRFTLQPRGLVEVKGKGPMPTWFLQGPARGHRVPARSVAHPQAGAG